MNLLAQGVDVSVIALWLGHQRTQSADAYLHADMNIKQAAINWTRPPNTKPGAYHPEPDILAWLETLSNMPTFQTAATPLTCAEPRTSA